jgi:uncharacterized protein YciI
MGEWIFFLHAPREDFAATMTEEEAAVWGRHFERLKRLTADGVVVLAGPTLGPVNTGIVVFEALDEAAAQAFVDADPVVSGGYARAELRPFRVSLLRGRE